MPENHSSVQNHQSGSVHVGQNIRDINAPVAGRDVVINNYYSNTSSSASIEATATIGLSPYPGLKSFEPHDAHHFYGRGVYIERLRSHVENNRLTALLGPSGSGKSSLVLAGLAPHLHEDDGRNWRFTYCRIGNEEKRNPFMALARALVPFYVESSSDTDRIKNIKQLSIQLQNEEIQLSDVFSDIFKGGKHFKLLLIFDQFEELFTLVDDQHAKTSTIESDENNTNTSNKVSLQEHFINILLEGFERPVDRHISQVHLIITMRADFKGAALGNRTLADALQNNEVNLGPMNRDELKESILKPAKNLGVDFESGLIDALVDKITSNPGSLPLLQFTLREMWEKIRAEKKSILTHHIYNEIGGIDGALTRRAETIYSELQKQEAPATVETHFRQLFIRLVTFGEGQEDTRRVAMKEEFSDSVWQLAQLLTHENNRLIVTNLLENQVETLEVVHEALIRHWPRLKDWIKDNRKFMSWLAHIKPSFMLWLASPDDTSLLLRGNMLIQASEWYSTHNEGLSEKEKQYVSASLKLKKQEEDEKEAQIQKELNYQKQLAQQYIEIAKQNEKLKRQVARSQFYIAKIHNDNQEFFEAAQAVMVSLNMPLELNDPDQLNLYGELLRTEQDSFLTPIFKHKNPVTNAQFDSSGEKLLTISGNIVQIWNAKTGHPIGAAMAHESRVDSAIFDPKGDCVVTASANAAQIWDAKTGHSIGAALAHENRVDSAIFDPKGECIVTVSADTAQIWDAKTGQPLGFPMAHKQGVRSASFDPKGERIVTASWDKTAQIWDAKTGHPIGAAMAHKEWVSSASFDPKGERIVTASWDKTAQIWDAKTGHPIGTAMAHKEWVRSASFDPKGERIVTVSADTAQIWDAKTGHPIGTAMAHKGQVNSASFDPKGERIVTASEDNTAQIWDAKTGHPIGTAMAHKGAVNSASFDPKGERIVTASEDNTAQIWDAKTGHPLGAVMVHQDWVSSASFDSKGEHIVTASANAAQIWNAKTGYPLGTAMAHKDVVSSASFDSKGERIVTASANAAQIWDAKTGHPLGTAMAHKDKVISASFDSKGKRIVTASLDNTAQIWDAKTGHPLGAAMAHKDSVSSASFDPKGERIVTASWDNTAQIWDVKTGHPLGAAMAHKDRVISASFDSKGERIVTASLDNKAQIWDAKTGHPLGAPMAHKGAVSSASFDPKGERIITISGNKAQVWDASFTTGEVLVNRIKAILANRKAMHDQH